MKMRSLVTVGFVVLGLTPLMMGCGPIRLGTSGDEYEPPLKEEYRAADKVQAIVMGQDNPSDKSLRGQYSYTVGPDRRLLVIYTFAQDLVEKAETRRGKMLLRIAIDHRTSQGKSVEGIQVAPLLRHWVLGSTWFRFNGFLKGKAAEWSNPGGDFDWVGIKKGTLMKPRPISGAKPPSSSSGSTTTSSSTSTTTTSVPEVFEYVYFD
ncbi:MAG: hypothetical protein K2X47_11160, partial [Bdellovibrionales bacterium]|nr:hypothetical protein [Bdellovibrionales bacterium]